MHNLTKIAAVLLMLLGLALGIYAWMLSRNAAVPPPAENVSRPATSWPIIVAAKPLPAGVPIKTEDVRVERLTSRAEGSFTTIPAVVGQVPATDIGAGMPISEQQLTSGLALKVADGERAVAIRVDEVVGVGNRVRPGDFVDVFLVVKRDGNEIDRSKARLLLARKKVLAYGASSVDAQPSAQQSGGVAGASAGSPPPNAGNANNAARPDNARTAVLSIPLAEVNALALAGSSGVLLLALRNPADGEQPDAKMAGSASSRATAGIVLAEVTAFSGKAPAPMAGPGAVASVSGSAAVQQARTTRRMNAVPAATAEPGVEIIRGSKREVIAN